VTDCPRCGQKVTQVVEHQKIHDLPEFAVPRWECTVCGWRSDHPPKDQAGRQTG
jgi:ribosomal protein S27AE